VSIGNNCCISQGAYLCTGSHRWDKETFDLETRPIMIEDHCWVGAMARVGPGLTIGEGVVLMMGSTATSSLAPGWVYGGNPALALKLRINIDGHKRDVSGKSE